MSVRLLCSAPCGQSHFVFRLRSNALAAENIPEGSRLLACPSTPAQSGHLVIARTPFGIFVRFLKVKTGRVLLDARNPTVPPIILPENAVEILGCVCAVLY